MQAGFIGLGALGEPMARTLARAGLLAGVWNRTAARAESFAATTGVEAFTDPASLAAACDLVFLCVSADDDVLEVVAQLAGHLRPGAIVIDCSTVSAATARRPGSAAGPCNRLGRSHPPTCR